MSICAHTLVKNEGRFLWFSVTSVIDHVDKLLLWDTGSTDNTKEIIKLLKEKYSNKIETKFVGSITSKEFPNIRQQMLEVTKSDWILIVDGDEVWWEESIKKVTSEMRKSLGQDLESIVVPAKMLIGDMYHYQEEKAGRYSIAGKTGHLNLRAFKRNIKGLKAVGEHGVFGWMDGKGKLIEKRSASKIRFIDYPHLHASFLQRSDEIKGDEGVVKRKAKKKLELGISFPSDYFFPEAFFNKRPNIVKSPWKRMNLQYKTKSFFVTPLKKLRRRTVLSKVKHGY